MNAINEKALAYVIKYFGDTITVKFDGDRQEVPLEQIELILKKPLTCKRFHKLEIIEQRMGGDKVSVFEIEHPNKEVYILKGV